MRQNNRLRVKKQIKVVRKRKNFFPKSKTLKIASVKNDTIYVILVLL
jgi:hypothetical protein